MQQHTNNCAKSVTDTQELTLADAIRIIFRQRKQIASQRNQIQKLNRIQFEQEQEIKSLKDNSKLFESRLIYLEDLSANNRQIMDMEAHLRERDHQIAPPASISPNHFLGFGETA